MSDSAQYNPPGFLIVGELGPEPHTVVQFRGDPGQNVFKIKFFHFENNLVLVVTESTHCPAGVEY